MLKKLLDVLENLLVVLKKFYLLKFLRLFFLRVFFIQRSG